MIMGRETVEIRVLFSVSRHNSPQDAADDALVEDFGAAVGALAALPRYADVITLDEGCTEPYRAMDEAREWRVRADLVAAYAAVIGRARGGE